MRSIWLIFGCLLATLVGIRFFYRPAAGPVASSLLPAPRAMLVSQRGASPAPAASGPRSDSLVRFALRQLGTPYVWAGTSPLTGFDCSGFITYVFGHFGVATPHATALLIDAGRPVPRAQAQPGDIVVFTGTAAGSTTPGHAGIVISALGETPLRFVHASSARRESGVKVSQVENSDYERRFMQVRRVLDGSAAGAVVAGAGRPAASRPVAQARPASPMATLPATVPAVIVPTAPLPAHVVPLPQRPKASAKRHLTTRASTRKKPAPVRMPHKASKKRPTLKLRAKAVAKPKSSKKKAAKRR